MSDFLSRIRTVAGIFVVRNVARLLPEIRSQSCDERAEARFEDLSCLMHTGELMI